MRLAYYAGASTAAAAACLLKAFHQRPNFYSATVYLSQSNACLLILTNLLLVAAASFMFALQRLLYGPLRPIEIEQLSEKAWYAVLDTLLAMPSFREDVGGWLLAMFVLLLAGKVWGWIGEGRVDILEQGQPPSNPKLFHVRLATSLVVSVAFDVYMLNYCIETVVADPRPGMMVIFTFEFAIVAVFSIFTLARYGLALVQKRIEKKQLDKAIEDRKAEIRAERAAARQNETADGTPTPAAPPSEEPIEVDENEVDVPGWEEKRRYLFFLEVMTDFIKLMIYIVFFTVSITFNGLPMHIMRDVYMTFASFSKRVSDYVAYKKATSDMNTRYPDATTEEIRGDACIVCRESMVAWDEAAPNAQPEQQDQDRGIRAQEPNGGAAPAANAGQGQRRRDEGLRAKKLPCGHILHLRCLKAWLERQQVCPTCRRPVVVAGANPNAPQQGNQRGQARQQPGQAAPRAGRARILNLGPIRIGFLNGPGDQIGNLVRQMQNQNRQQNQVGQQQARQGGQEAGGQQGPNHLGLQVPYMAAGAGAAAGPTGLRSGVPTHVQLQQIEQRLMQEAHALNLEQQQLATLRAMESHMTYLRNLHQQIQQNSTNFQAQQRQPPMQMAAPQALQPQVQAFNGNSTQVLRAGDEGVPEGMVLPEGWTLTPLRPIREHTPGLGNPTANVQQPPGVLGGSSQQQQAQTQTQSGETGAAGEGMPRNENGSPLFVPTHPPPADAATNTASSTTDSQPPTQNGQSIPPRGSSLPPSEPQNNEARNPWNTEGDSWNFPDPPTDTPNGVNGAHAASSSANGAPASPSPDQQNGPAAATEKGKARQVEVEEVPDEEASGS